MSERNVTPSGSNLPVKPGVIILIIVGILVLSGAFTSVYTVDETERAVILRFGKFLPPVVGSGLHTKLPFGIDTVYKVPVKNQTMEFGYRTVEAGINTTYARGDYSSESEMLSGDLNIINTEWSIIYRISNPTNYLFKVKNPEITIRDISQSVINRLVGDTAILGVIGAERDRIGNEATSEMNRILGSYDMGIEILQVDLQSSTHPSSQVQDAFEDVNVAEQDMNTLINEGKEEYNKIIPAARGEAEKIVLDAQAYASERTNRAKGDVARFVAVRDEWEKNKEVTETRMEIETWEEILKNGNTVLIDKDLAEKALPLSNINIQGAAR